MRKISGSIFGTVFGVTKSLAEASLNDVARGIKKSFAEASLICEAGPLKNLGSSCFLVFAFVFAHFWGPKWLKTVAKNGKIGTKKGAELRPKNGTSCLTRHEKASLNKHSSITKGGFVQNKSLL